MNSTLLRRLEGIERLAAIGNTFQRGCFNLVAMAEVEGPITAELLQRALVHIQQKFECLNVEVVPDPGCPHQWVFKRTDELVKLTVVNFSDSTQRIEFWNELSVTPIEGLAWRIIWARQQDTNKSYIIGLYHHAVLDGGSIGYLLDLLLQVMHYLSEEKEHTLPFQPMTPATHRFVEAHWPIIALARIGYYRHFRRLRTIALDPRNDDLANRRWHSVFKTLENEVVEELLARCRLQSVKLGNAFSAALIVETAEHIRQYEKKPFDLALSTTFDLRHFNKDKKPPPSVGTLLSAIPSFFRPAENDTLWDVARNAAHQLHRSILWEENRHLSLLQNLISTKMAALQIHHNQGRPPIGALVLSNLGRFSHFEHGPFRAATIQATAAQAAWGCTLFLGLVTIRGRLCITLSYPYPSVSNETAQSILDGIILRLS